MYWYIIVGLALFGFGLVTAIGCSKLYTANAQESVEGVYFPNLKEINFGSDDEFLREVIDTHPYVVVSGETNDPTFFSFLFMDYSDSLYFREFYNSSNAFAEIRGQYVIYIDDGKYHSYRYNCGLPVRATPESTYTGYLIGTNFELQIPSWLVDNELYTSFVNSAPQNNIVHPKDYVAPPVEGFDRLGFVPQLVSSRHIGIGLWHCNYTPSVGSVNDEGEIVYPNVRVSYRLNLPTPSLVKSWVDNGLTKKDFDNNDITLWRGSGAGSKYEVIDYFSPLTADNGYFTLNLRGDISNAWNVLYPGIDASALDMVIRFAYPDVIVSSAYYDEYGTMVYGPKLVQFATSFSSDAKEVYYADSEYLYTGHYSSIADYIEAVSSVREEQDNVEDWLKEEKYNAALEENERLKEQVDSLREQLASVGNSDGGLWDTFDNIVGGFKSASDTFVDIGHVIGNVFSFMPVEVTGMLVFVFTALLVLAVYWAIRGK